MQKVSELISKHSITLLHRYLYLHILLLTVHGSCTRMSYIYFTKICTALGDLISSPEISKVLELGLILEKFRPKNSLLNTLKATTV